MKCSTCGNEVSPEEAFCGQCGAPTSSPGQARPTEMVSSSLVSQNLNGPYTQSNLSFANQQSLRPSSPNQQENFYQDATEAMTVLPGTGDAGIPGQPGMGYGPSRPQTGFPGAPMSQMPAAYPGSGQYVPQIQPYQNSNYAGPGSAYSQPASFTAGQGYDYGTRGGMTPPPHKQKRNTTMVIVVGICVTIVLLTTIGFGTLYFLQHNQQGSTPNPVATPSTAPALAPTPTQQAPSPTLTPIDTPTPTPSPTVSPTPTPDPGFTWCAQCMSDGFGVEYPNGWQVGPTSNDPQGIQFTNPAQQDQFASFKAPGQTSSTASELVANDLQNYMSKDGFTASNTAQTATIGNVTWVKDTAYYHNNNQQNEGQNQQNNNQKERVIVYATVYQGKAYVIELNAADDQFDGVSGQYFTNMLNSFQFVQNPS